MALSLVDRNSGRDAVRVFCGVDSARAQGQAIDYLGGVYPVDAHVDQVRKAWPERYRQWVESRRYPSQECVAIVNTGRGMDPEKWRERKHCDARLRAQTEDLAAALERTGVRARNAGDVVAVGLVTGAVEALNSYRKICFLPTVAQRDRRPMLNELHYFREHHDRHDKFMRYAVVTSGPRVPLGGLPPPRLLGEPKAGPYYELRDRISKLSRSISRFAQWACETHDIDVVFRGIEFTVEQREGDDFLSAHPHANVLYTPGRKLKKAEWTAFLKGAGEQFGWWRDCGKLRDPNEAIKYPFKPAELDSRRIGDAGVRWLYEQTFGLPMAQPMGAFKAWRSDELWTIAAGADGKPRPRQHRKVVSLEYPTGTELGLCSIRHRSKPESTTVKREDDRRPLENLLLGITAPQRRHSAWSEPQALVMGYTESPGSELGQDALERMAAESVKATVNWYRNGAPDPGVALAVSRGQAAAREGEAVKVAAFSVHTRTSTAEQKRSLNCGQGPPGGIASTAVDERRHFGR